MTLAANYDASLTLTETFTGPYISSADATATINGLNENIRLDGATTPPVSKGAAFQKVLSGGAGTIDLTSMPGLTADETITLTGLKLQMVKFRNKSSNANPITITFGAANPYNLFGAAFVIVLAVGQSFQAYLNGAAPTVGGGAKISTSLAQVRKSLKSNCVAVEKEA